MFRDDARLDPSQVGDRRGRGGLGKAAGLGGGAGLIFLLLSLLLGADPSQLIDNPASSPSDNTNLAQNCQTGADANRQEDCRIVGFVNSIQDYWQDDFRGRGWQYQLATTELFSGSTSTSCGFASSAAGPFYCPPEQKIFIDLSFFDELQSRFGAQGGPFAQAYVLAHEYGHHVQNLRGVLDRIGNDRQGAQSAAVRAELQADCLAGVWAGNAVDTGYLNPLTEAQIAEALSAAAAVGDDRIQRQTRGRVDTETWTHGSSEQRQRWFMSGYNRGELEACDTFSGSV